MIDLKNNPVEWSSLMYELDDAKEHLEELISEMSKHGEVDDIEFQHSIAHVYAHLNRAFNSRNKIGQYTDTEREVFTRFPSNLEPIG